MLRRLKVEGFKSLRDLDVTLPRLAVVFGPNAAGKSNLLDAVQMLAALVRERTVDDALNSSAVRGYPIEQFTLPPGGLPALLDEDSVGFTVEADIAAGPTDAGREGGRYRYRVGVSMQPRTAKAQVAGEYLARLRTDWQPHQGVQPRIEAQDGSVVVRQRRRGGRPVTEPLSLNYTQLSNLRYSDDRYADLAQARQEFATWRTYYLDPREAMRRALPPREVDDIAANGGNLAPFLYALKNGRTKHFDAVVRAARNLIPAIEGLDVELDRERGELDIRVSQDGTTYSSRVVSEGTLRVLALCAIAATPWPSPLVAFEEPENGVHPRRIELIANLLRATAFAADRQVLITTHSPVLVASILRQQREFPDLDIGVFVCRREGRDTTFKKFASAGPLLDDPEIRAAFREQDDASVLQRLIISGWIDG